MNQAETCFWCEGAISKHRVLALPGGFAEMRENLEDTARRELEEETGVKDLPLEQFAVYGDYDRDPRTRVITTAYLSLVNEQDITVRAGMMRRTRHGAASA